MKYLHKYLKKKMEEDKNDRKYSEDLVDDGKSKENEQPEKKMSEQKVF